jgi:ABC-type nickel/cobalt efflux system permease component RcnA
MEIVAGFANTITILVALGLKYNLEWLTTHRSNAILLAANVAAVLAFLVALVIVPCRIFNQKRRVKKQNKEAEERMRDLNKANKLKHDNRHKAQAAAAQQEQLQPDSPPGGLASPSGIKVNAVAPISPRSNGNAVSPRRVQEVELMVRK